MNLADLENEYKTIKVNKWEKIIFNRFVGNTLIIGGKILIDDISIMYDSDLDQDPTKNDNVGLSKILEQVIDDILESKTNNEDE